MIKITSKITFLVFCFFITACSSMGTGIKGVAEPPKVSVKDVRFEQFTWQGGEAVFVLQLSNPNAFSLPLTGIDYALALNGVEVGKGSREQSIKIPAGQNRQVEFPLRLSFVNMASLLPELMSQGAMQYQLRGAVHLPLFKIPFMRSGSTRLRP